MLYDTQDALEAAANSAKQGAAGTPGPRGAAGAPGAAGASTGPVGPSTINLTQFLGLLSQAQRAFIPQFASLPGLQDPASQDGDLISVNGILYRFDGSTQPGAWKPQASVAAIIEDTYANWVTPAYDPTTLAVGTLFLNTTWNVVYAIQAVAGVNKWLYLDGTYTAATGSRPTTGFNGVALGANDTGLQFRDSTLTIDEYWNGTTWVQVPAVPASATVLASNANHQIIAAALASADIWVGNGSNLPVAVAPSGDLTINNTGVFTLATVNASPGNYGDSTHTVTATVNGKGLVTSLSQNAIAFPSSFGSITIVPTPVAGLPGTPGPGCIAAVNDALAPVAGAPVAAGGAAFAAVEWNGSQWTVYST